MPSAARLADGIITDRGRGRKGKFPEFLAGAWRGDIKKRLYVYRGVAGEASTDAYVWMGTYEHISAGTHPDGNICASTD